MSIYFLRRSRLRGDRSVSATLGRTNRGRAPKDCDRQELQRLAAKFQTKPKNLVAYFQNWVSTLVCDKSL